MNRRADMDEALADWNPAEMVAEGDHQVWKVHSDGSITIRLPGTIAWNLGEVLLEMEAHAKDWTGRPDCQNWKRSAIARENRRETITYSNIFETLKAYLGRPEVLALMQRVRTEKGGPHAE